MHCTIRCAAAIAVCALAGCGPRAPETTDWEDQPLPDTGTEEDAGAPPPCDSPPTVDGRFTSWPLCAEYPAVLRGLFGDLHVAYREGRLFLLNDWHARIDGPTPASFYNLFRITTGGGRQSWEVRLHGDSTMEVHLDGEPWRGAEGVASFAPSPTYDFDHTIYELAVDVLPGAVTLFRSAPCSGSRPKTHTPEAALVDEPTIVMGRLGDDGAKVRVADGPVLTALEPAGGAPGDEVVLHGYQLGRHGGTVAFGGALPAPLSWSDRRIRVRVPELARITDLDGEEGWIAVAVWTEAGRGDALSFEVRCGPGCEGRECGRDGCGRPCGTCEAGVPCEEGRCREIPRCQGAPVVDGRFTDWPDCDEYDEVLRGRFGDLHVAYEEGRLHLLNDWHSRDDGPIPSSFYNLFGIGTGGGREYWEVRIFGDSTMELLLNGTPFPAESRGVATFGPSPHYGFEHTIYELAVDVLPGPLTIYWSDPKTGSWPETGYTPESALVEEPTVGKGTLGEEGSRLWVADGPTLMGVSPASGHPGQEVVLRGRRLDVVWGTVLFGPGVGVVSSWTDASVRVVVPSLSPGPVSLRLRAGGGESNALVFVVEPVPPCLGRECGDDGHGGSCGECPPDERCSRGRCSPRCEPSCAGLECGWDGCGGSCGECAAAERCDGGRCVPVCVPECAGRQCGGDRCGGSCGVCRAAERCEQGRCEPLCVPECADRQCGGDRCGGSCGQCAADERCANGRCVPACVPECAGRECGRDGCGGSCGECPPGEECLPAGVCQAPCVPDCEGRDCGDDGCDGSCGQCEPPLSCDDGKCSYAGG